MTIFEPEQAPPEVLAKLDRSFSTAPRRRRHKKLHVTMRDVRVLELLVARRVESLDALHRLAFPGVSRKRALNRLGELVSGGFLDRRSVHLPGQDGLRSVYFLTKRGRTALSIRSDEANAWFASHKWKLDLSEPSIPHQVVTNRVCDWMGVHAIPEHLLPPLRAREVGYGKARQLRRPDAVFAAAEPVNGSSLVWLEVDLGHYSRQRIIEKVEGFRDAQQAGAMLIACQTAARERWLVDLLVEKFTGSIWERLDVKTFDELRNGKRPNLMGDVIEPAKEIPMMLPES